MRRPILVPLLVLLALARPGEAGEIKGFQLPDPSGQVRRLDEFEGRKATVLFFIGVECPMSTRYLSRMNDLYAKYHDQGIGFLAINANPLESAESVAAHAKASGLKFPVLLDRDLEVADRFEVEVQPCAVLLGAKRGLHYSGRIDDNKTEQLARNHYLADAIEAALAGREPPVASTEPVGCRLQHPMAESRDSEVTYANPVAGLLNRNCVQCHRPGQVAPFPLDSYEQAKKWALNIAAITRSRAMPPWKPVNHGTFRDERVMTPEEIDLLDRWVAAGAPEGDPAQAPVPPKIAEGWMLGEPDLILEAPEYEVPAEGDDEYRCFVLPTSESEDRWVQAVELRPGNLNVVHHIIAYVDTRGAAEKLDAADPKPGYLSHGTGPGFIPAGEMSGWAPGTMPYALEDGVGRLLPKGGRVVLEVHYHKNGRPEKDRTRLGLTFAKKPVQKRLRWVELINFGFVIPPGKDRFRVTATEVVDRDLHARSIMPHMHLTGREIRVTARFPDGTKQTLVDIRDWDFNWQDIYHFKEPIPLPKGTRLTLTAIYDNSEGNPNNPNHPPQPLTWGEQTTDEMCIGFISCTRDAEDLTAGGGD
ncbi:MAG: redoxin domain-containing protein [Planctomycetes bacterium]|nr:redoxin domain-containing protein [Planctomycetota bacterium]